MKSAAHALNDIPFHLILDPVGIDHQAAIMGRDDPLHSDLTGSFVHFDFGDGRDIDVGAPGGRDAAPFGEISMRCGNR